MAGDITVSGEADLAGLVHASRIDGSLIVRRSSLERLDLPELTEVTGSLRVEKNPALRAVDLGGLAAVGSGGGGRLIVENNDKLANLGLGALGSAPGGLAIRANPALARVDLSSIESAAGSGIEIASAFEVTDLDLGRLTSTTRLVVESCQRLGRLGLGSLRRADAVWIIANPSLKKIVPPAPATGGGDAGPPRRPGGADKLIRVRDNDALRSCEGHRLRDRLVEHGFGGTAELCLNRADTCPDVGCP